MGRQKDAATRNRSLVIQWARQNVSQTEIARRIHTNRRYVRRLLLKEGIPLPKQLLDMRHNPNWRGGRQIDKQGYVLLKIPGHHLANGHGYVREHRLVAEQKLGRRLTSDEVVHHLDDDPANNDPDNLRVYPTNGHHLADTLQGQTPNWTPVGWERIQEGIRHAVVARRRAASQRCSKRNAQKKR